MQAFLGGKSFAVVVANTSNSRNTAGDLGS